MNLFSEMRASWQLRRYTLYSALIKISLRNAGSSLGWFWEVLSTFLVSLILSTVWIKVLGVEGGFLDYFIYVYVGMVIWGWLSGAVSNLCATLVKNAKQLTSRNLPLTSYLFEDILISSIPFLMSLPFVVVICFVGGLDFSIGSAVMFIMGCALVLITSFSFSLSIGLASFFLGDIRQIITAVMRLSFLVTPIIWKAERLGDSAHLLLLNPFYGYLHVLRSSVMGVPVETPFLIQAVCITLFLSGLALIMYWNLRSKIQQRALAL